MHSTHAGGDPAEFLRIQACISHHQGSALPRLPLARVQVFLHSLCHSSKKNPNNPKTKKTKAKTLKDALSQETKQQNSFDLRLPPCFTPQLFHVKKTTLVMKGGRDSFTSFEYRLVLPLVLSGQLIILKCGFESLEAGERTKSMSLRLGGVIGSSKRGCFFMPSPPPVP